MTNGGSNNLPLFSPDSDPYGVSYAEWTAKWWQWVLSIPVENNPAYDMTGKNCGINQSGPVWFLAGTVVVAKRNCSIPAEKTVVVAKRNCSIPAEKTVVVAKRNCSIPAEKAILFPILNHGGTLADEPTIKSEEELILLAKREMDVISNLEVTVDGMKLNGLERYRVRSPIFDVVLPEDNLFGGTPGPTRGAADGYWIFLEPLPIGEYKVHSFGSCLSGKVSIGVNYDITVI